MVVSWKTMCLDVGPTLWKGGGVVGGAGGGG